MYVISKITLDEFILGVVQLRMHVDKSLIERAFEILDLDGDGYIDREELRKYVLAIIHWAVYVLTYRLIA